MTNESERGPVCVVVRQREAELVSVQQPPGVSVSQTTQCDQGTLHYQAQPGPVLPPSATRLWPEGAQRVLSSLSPPEPESPQLSSLLS